MKDERPAGAKFDPDDHVRLAQDLLRSGDKIGAAALLRKASELGPDTYKSKYHLARACYHEQNLDASLEALREAIVLKPDFGDAYRLMGQELQQLGRFSEAEEYLRKAIELESRSGQAYMNLVSGRSIAEPDRPFIEQMLHVLRSTQIMDSEKCLLHYALGKSFDDLGQYECAMRHFDKANAIAAIVKLRGRPFNPEKLRAVYSHAAAVFTKEFFSKHRSLGSASRMPIFVVGMLRSGTTLTEQIVSCHPEIVAGGELPFWAKEGAGVFDQRGRNISGRHLHETQEGYLDLLNGLAPTKKHVTDKRPGNVYSLGLIHLAFPNAKILYCRRDPVDTALSIYMTPNSAPLDFGYVRESIVVAYRENRRLMELYKSVLPEDTIMDICYEDLVSDQERVTRQIIGFLGLEWNDACLHHEKNERVVNTPTLWQVRQPIYTTSVKRWKNYEPWLGAFKELIEERAVP